jgi:hypothetical protein
MKLSAVQRRELALVADAGPRGVPETILVDVHGFTIDALAGLVRAALQR